MIYCYCECVFHDDDNNTCMLNIVRISDLTKKGYLPVCEDYIEREKFNGDDFPDE